MDEDIMGTRFGRARVYARRAVKAFSLVILSTHFALTVLYCLPLNPLKMKHESMLMASIGTYFYQNWSLFAPNPISSNQSLMVKCLTSEQAAAQKEQHTLDSEGWFNLTEPLMHAHQANRFAAYDRLTRPHTNFVKQFLGGSLPLATLSTRCRAGNKRACAEYEHAIKGARQSAMLPLAKIGSSFCNGLPADRSYTHVALRVREQGVAPWSQRHAKQAPSARDLELGTFYLVPDVANTNMYEGVL